MKALEEVDEPYVPLFGYLATILSQLGDWQIFMGSCALLTGFYYAVRTQLPSSAERQKAWAITFASSLVMSITGLYFAFRLFMAKGTVLLPDPLAEDSDSDAAKTDTVVAHALCLFFLAYCVVDVFFGLVHYYDHVNIGFTHHTSYAVLLVYLLRTGRSLLFAVAAIEEIPTLVLSVFELSGDLRPRLATGLTIFTFRVTYHAFVTYKASELLNTPLFFLSTYLLLDHIAWFRAWFMLRVEQVKAESEAKGSHDRAKASAKEKRLKLEVTTHVYLVTVLLVAQAAMHAWLVAVELSKYADYKEDWNARSWATLLLLVDLAGHFFCFFLVAARMAGIIQDVYTEHFIMHTIEKRSVIYNISWEDPRVERELLKMGPNDVVLTISSAGCNVLDYLVTEPEAIVACDFNLAQLAMLELKLACIEHLDHAAFWAIWAESDYAAFTAHWPKLRAALVASGTRTALSTATFWDENGHLFRDNIMFAGSSGLAARLLTPLIGLLGLKEYMVGRKGYPPATVGLALLRGFLQSQVVWTWLAPLGGVPESQLNLINREPHVWAERLEEVLGRRMWSGDNYFYYAYVAGRWDPACCPPYMKPENFAALKRGAKRRAVTLVHGGWADGAQLRDDFTVASLLDSMDWMPDSMIAENLARLYPRMSDGTRKDHILAAPKKAGTIFWRSFATKVHSPVLAHLRPRLVPDEDGRERVGWYLSQWVAPVVPGVDFKAFLCQGSGETYKNTVAQDVQVMAAMAQHALREEKDTVAFYRSQGSAYDGFRETLLPRRDVLQHYCLPWHRAPKIWISVGCGTARDMEYVIGHLMSTGCHLFLLDLSPALLAMAKERVEKHGLGHQVTLVVADVLEAYDGNKQPRLDRVKYLDTPGKRPLPPLGTADVVTCSYCLTMIPPWEAALQTMVGMLRPGGTLALIDFTKREDMPRHWSQELNQWWFAHDGVYFNEAHTAWLKDSSKSGLQTVWYTEFENRVPYTLLQATSYLYTGVKR